MECETYSRVKGTLSMRKQPVLKQDLFQVGMKRLMCHFLGSRSSKMLLTIMIEPDTVRTAGLRLNVFRSVLRKWNFRQKKPCLLETMQNDDQAAAEKVNEEMLWPSSLKGKVVIQDG